LGRYGPIAWCEANNVKVENALSRRNHPRPTVRKVLSCIGLPSLGAAKLETLGRNPG